MPYTGTTAVDKAAANRFIKHAIAQVKAQRPPGDDEGAGPSHIRFGENGEATKLPVKVTSKMVARAQYEKELAEAVSEEEDALEVIDDEEPSDTIDVNSRKDKGKGKVNIIKTKEKTSHFNVVDDEECTPVACEISVVNAYHCCHNVVTV